MHSTIKNIIQIEKEIKEKIFELKYSDYSTQIIAVSKTFPIDHILHLVDYGHINFGENKVQEAIEKWTDIKAKNKNIKLHMIGKLQTNKVKNALKIFDYIHSVDSLKLAKKISSEQVSINKKIKIFIQINIGSERQKSGIDVEHLDELYNFCKQSRLDVIGLMCLPPFESSSAKYFSKLKDLNDNMGFTDISMGMSHDYLEAIKFKSTFLRIGSKIFGNRS